ncbi:MAG: hypothetical protein IJZ34_17565 [Lachnospiraceae bacterium]|nr:hypothetical protein [Lachnospiraceae bacterium]
MEYNKNEWFGRWTNFESYIYSEEPAMKQCWAEAEEIAKAMPMFKNGAKAFWQIACNTINEENPVRLGGWNIAPTIEAMSIEWLGENGQSLGKQDYILSTIIPKGLEAKENFLFEATNAPENWPFRYLLAMAPMPERSAKNSGGLLSHLHFQYASNLEMLLKDGVLCKPMWYATMCDGEGTLLERCNIIRALHRIPTKP